MLCSDTGRFEQPLLLRSLIKLIIFYQYCQTFEAGISIYIILPPSEDQSEAAGHNMILGDVSRCNPNPMKDP